MSSEQQYIDLYNRQRTLLDAGSPDALNACRDAAYKAFAANGLPTHRLERYKYCDVQAAFAPDYGLNLRRSVPAADPYETYRCAVPNLSASVYYVVNDTPVIIADKTAPLPEGVSVCAFRNADGDCRRLIETHYQRAAGKDCDGVAALNTMLAQDGLLIHIPDGACLDHPLQIVNVAVALQPLMAVRRVLIIAGRGAKGNILFCDHAIGQTDYLTTQVVEVFAAADADVALYSLEETSGGNRRFNNVYVEQQAGSHVSYNGIVLTCGQTRNTVDFRLLGPGACAVANGAIIADGHQRVDNNILVDHIAPNCQSDLLYKYVLDGHSTGAYAGRVLVRHDAQKTASQQTNANICAAPTAHAFAQPMLEIYADDVKCNHGSSTGKLDEAALFYMRQRGIPESEARLLLQHAFINDVLRRIGMEQLRDRLSHLVELRFRGQLSQCRECHGCGTKD